MHSSIYQVTVCSDCPFCNLQCKSSDFEKVEVAEELDVDEEEMLSKAIALSLEEHVTNISEDDFEDSKGALDEDEMLRRAIALSLEEHVGI